MLKRIFLKHKLSSKIIGAVLALFFLMAGGFLARPSLAEYALSKAGYYFNGGAYNLSAAAKWYKVAAFLGSESPLIHYQLARIYFVENKSDEAKKEIDIALVKNPDNQRAFYVRGLIDGFAKNYDEAISDFEKFTAWSPQEWAGWNDLAWVSYEAGDYVKTKNAALEGLKIDANNPWLLNNLGLAYLGLGEKDQAQEIFAKTKNNAESLTLEEWQKAYPGNNPNSAEWDLAKFRADIIHNATLASGQAPLTVALSKGISVSACGASTYGTCSGGTCQANSCTTCDSSTDESGVFGGCCSWYTSACSSNSDCAPACSGGASPTCASYSDQQTVNVYSYASGRTGEWWCDNHFGGNVGGTWDCISVSGGYCPCDAPLGSNVTCGRCGPPPCTPNGCAADICIGQWCNNGCDWVQGTKYPDGCAADTCAGQWCHNGCDWVQGTKYPNGCQASRCPGDWCDTGCGWADGTKYCPPGCTPNNCQASHCPGDWCDTGCGWADGTKVCISAPAPTLIFSGTYNGTTAQTLNNVPANSNVTLNWSTNASTTFCDAWGGDATWDAYSPSSAGDSSTRTVPGTLTYTMECWNAASISTGPETVRVNVACVDSFVPWTTVNCDKSCGGGTKTRTGSCTGIVQTQICNSQPCPPGYREVAPW